MSIRQIVPIAGVLCTCFAVTDSAWAGLENTTVTSRYFAYGGPDAGGGQPGIFAADGAPRLPFGDDSALTVFDDRMEYGYAGPVTRSISPPSFASLSTDAGARVVVDVETAPVPEPSGLALLGAGACVLGLLLIRLTGRAL